MTAISHHPKPVNNLPRHSPTENWQRGTIFRWLKKWFLSARWLRGTLEGQVLNWLRSVVDSVKGGSKNGSSLPVLRGTTPGKIINWLGVVADRCHLET